MNREGLNEETLGGNARNSKDPNPCTVREEEREGERERGMKEERKKETKERKDEETFGTLELSMRDRCLHRISSISLSAIESKQKKKKVSNNPSLLRAHINTALSVTLATPASTSKRAQQPTIPTV